MSNAAPSKSVCICLECSETFDSARAKFKHVLVAGVFCSRLCAAARAKAAR